MRSELTANRVLERARQIRDELQEDHYHWVGLAHQSGFISTSEFESIVNQLKQEDVN